MKLHVVAILLMAMIGGSMVVVAALVGKTNTSDLGTQVTSSRDIYSSKISGTSQSYWRGNSSWAIENLGNTPSLSYLLLLNYIGRNASFVFKDLNISISKAMINGSLVSIEGGVAYVKADSTIYKIAIPQRLFNGERVLYLDEALLLRYLNKDDILSIRALNITISSLRSGGIADFYIAIEILDMTTGKSLTIALPINIK
ncbi:MAG: hypothetical protein RQ885_05685 [Desulfurococcales archaeon]|jgi:hypothetical protein|nr:hypothetical protein [Desulfurococcales archaeon]